MKLYIWVYNKKKQKITEYTREVHEGSKYYCVDGGADIPGLYLERIQKWENPNKPRVEETFEGNIVLLSFEHLEKMQVIVCMNGPYTRQIEELNSKIEAVWKSDFISDPALEDEVSGNPVPEVKENLPETEELIVGVVQRRYGIVPVLVDKKEFEGKSLRGQKSLAQKTAQEMIGKDSGCITWDQGFDDLNVDFGFTKRIKTEE